MADEVSRVDRCTLPRKSETDHRWISSCGLGHLLDLDLQMPILMERVRLGNRSERLPSCSRKLGAGTRLKVMLHEIECDEDELLEIPKNWIHIRLELNGYAASFREAFTLHYLEKE